MIRSIGRISPLGSHYLEKLLHSGRPISCSEAVCQVLGGSPHLTSVATRASCLLRSHLHCRFSQDRQVFFCTHLATWKRQTRQLAPSSPRSCLLLSCGHWISGCCSSRPHSPSSPCCSLLSTAAVPGKQPYPQPYLLLLRSLSLLESLSSSASVTQAGDLVDQPLSPPCLPVASTTLPSSGFSSAGSSSQSSLLASPVLSLFFINHFFLQWSSITWTYRWL